MKKFLSVALALVMCLGAAACSGKRGTVANNAQTLEIYICNKGYGTDWLRPMVDAFLAQDWVKEKYPDGLTVPAFQSNSEDSFGTDRTTSGVTTIDLMIDTSAPNSSYDNEITSGVSYFEDLSGLYDTVIPGEGIKYRDKMQQNFYEMSLHTTRTGETKTYSVPWVTGMQGLIYNKTAFDALGISVPLTTDELINETCPAIIAGGKIPFVFSSSVGYWSCTVFINWWVQYEGLDNYFDYFNGLVTDGDEKIRSVDAIKQRGRLLGVEVIEDLIGSEGTTANKNVYPNVNTMSFTQAQAQFLLGNGLMMPNGDWFETEMRETKEEGVTDVFTFMRTPVISAITEKTPTITSDTMLREVIKAVDAGQTSYAGVSEADFKTVSDARHVVVPSVHHVAYVPSYATAKEAAKDFLLFMGTDEANRIFAEKTYGATMPFNYDIETKDPELFASFAQLHRDRITFSKNAIYTTDQSSFPLAYFGGLSRFARGDVDSKLATLNPSERQTAEQIYNNEISYWTADRWQSALVYAGYAS